jgi:hypothetical protein
MAQLTISRGENKPSLMTTVFDDNNKPLYASINLHIKSNNIEEGYIWDELTLPEFALSNIHNAPEDIKYNVLVAHIVKAYYDDNKMTAVLSNYLSDMTNTKYKKEFDDLQNLRKEAKESAKYIVENKLF